MTKELPWAVIEDDYDPYYRHVIPLGDLSEHSLDFECDKCWCIPRFEDGVVVHNSADKREFYERGERKIA